MSLFIPVIVHGVEVQAIVDTAAQRTIISRELYSMLNEPPESKGVLKLGNAEKDRTMEGIVIPGVQIQLGGREYSWELVVAPIEDTMLLEHMVQLWTCYITR